MAYWRLYKRLLITPLAIPCMAGCLRADDANCNTVDSRFHRKLCKRVSLPAFTILFVGGCTSGVFEGVSIMLGNMLCTDAKQDGLHFTISSTLCGRLFESCALGVHDV